MRELITNEKVNKDIVLLCKLQSKCKRVFFEFSRARVSLFLVIAIFLFPQPNVDFLIVQVKMFWIYGQVFTKESSVLSCQLL